MACRYGLSRDQLPQRKQYQKSIQDRPDPLESLPDTTTNTPQPKPILFQFFRSSESNMSQRPSKKTKHTNSKITTPNVKLIPGQSHLTNWLNPTDDHTPTQSTPRHSTTQTQDVAVPVTETKANEENPTVDIPLNQPSVQYKTPTQNGNDVESVVDSIYLGEHGVESEESSEDEVEVVEVSGNKMGIPMYSPHHNNECGGCGNSHNCCHEFLFGPFLCHEILSLFDSYQPHEVTDEVIEREFTSMYRMKLRVFCWDNMHKFDLREITCLQNACVNIR